MRDFARDVNLAWAEHWLCREESHSSRSQLISHLYMTPDTSLQGILTLPTTRMTLPVRDMRNAAYPSRLTVSLAQVHTNTVSPDKAMLAQVIVLAGGIVGGRQVQKQIHLAQKKQAQICVDIVDTRRKGKKKEKVAVDKIFYRRLLKILQMYAPFFSMTYAVMRHLSVWYGLCLHVVGLDRLHSGQGVIKAGMPCRCVPKLLSKEALLILIQGGFLVSRTFLTDRISRIEARAGRHLISQVMRLA